MLISVRLGFIRLPQCLLHIEIHLLNCPSTTISNDDNEYTLINFGGFKPRTENVWQHLEGLNLNDSKQKSCIVLIFFIIIINNDDNEYTLINFGGFKPHTENVRQHLEGLNLNDSNQKSCIVLIFFIIIINNDDNTLINFGDFKPRTENVRQHLAMLN